MTNLLHGDPPVLVGEVIKVNFRRKPKVQSQSGYGLESVTPSAGPILSWINVPRTSPIARRTIMPGAEASF
jgi:hypothetical protein